MQRGHVLNQVATLAVSHGDVLHALCSGEECLEDGHRVRDTRRDQGARQRPEWLTVDRHASLFVEAHQAVGILPVCDGLFDRMALGVGDVVRDAATLVRGESAGDGDLRQQARVGRTVAHLHGALERRGHVATDRLAIVHDRESVQHRAVRLFTLFDTRLGLVVTVQTRVAVHRRRQQVGLALGLEELEQLLVLLRQGHTGTRLDQSPAFLGSLLQLSAKTLLCGDGFLIGHGLVEIDVSPRVPLSKHLLTLGEEGVF